MKKIECIKFESCKDGSHSYISPFTFLQTFLSSYYKMSASFVSDSFPSGSWTLYFHDPEDPSWSPDSYKKIGAFSTYSALWGAFAKIDVERFLSGMFFLMRDPHLPLWEPRDNIHGGSYCIKVPEAVAHETFQRYVAAATLDMVSKDPSNAVIGVSISPKKGFHILKLWNVSSKFHNNPSAVNLFGDTMKGSDVLYRPHVDQKF